MTKIQIGGDVISASSYIIKSMNDLGSSNYNEIIAITNIQSDINIGASSQGTPNTIKGPPPFTPPK